MVYNSLSNIYNKLYIENLINFQSSAISKGIRDDWYVDFYPSFGMKRGEDCDFLVLGQAVNGWGTGFELGNAFDGNIEERISFSNKHFTQLNHNPLDWVNVQWSNSIYSKHTEDPEVKKFYSGSYRAYRSFFWQATYKLINDYYGLNRSEWTWSGKMVWSNLYKIAPDGKNPNYLERLCQHPFAFELLKRELEELSPKYCIVLTNGSWWEPFRDYLEAKPLEIPEEFSKIVYRELYEKTQIIVTTRPRFGSGEDHVRQILQLIK